MRRILALAVVGLVLGLGGAARAEGDAVTVGISNQAYTPVIATIHAGGTVTWVNNDEETHSVFIEAIGSDYLVAPGASWSYTFGDVGEFTYHCSLHNHAGKIVVAAAVATTQPPKPVTTTVATTVSTTLPATTAPTTVATTVSTVATTVATTAPPVTTAAGTTTVTVPTTPAATDSTPITVGAVHDGGGGLPSAALIGGGGAGAALGVGAGFVIKRRRGKRVSEGV